MTKIVIDKSGGELTILGEQWNAEITVLDWDSDDWSYDRCESLIREVLDSDLDGPHQFAIIIRIISRFNAENA